MEAKGRLQAFFLIVAVLLLRGTCRAAGEAPEPDREISYLDASGHSRLWEDMLDLLQGFSWGTLQAEPQLNYNLYYEDTFGGEKVEEFSHRFNPELDVELLVSKRFSIRAHTEEYIVEYQSEKDSNYVDQEYNLQLSITLAPMTFLSLVATYNVETDPERFYEEDAGSAEGNYIIKRSRDKTRTYSLFFQRRLSQRSQLTLLASYASMETAVTDDSHFYFADVNYKYNLTSKALFTLKGTFNRFDFKSGGAEDPVYLEDLAAGVGGQFFGTDSQHDNYNFKAGLNYIFNDTDRLRLFAGWRYVKRETTDRFVDPGTGELVTRASSASGDGVDFLLEFQKQLFGSLHLQLVLNQTVGNNPGSGATYENRTVRVKTTYAISKRLEGVLQGSYYGRETNGRKEFNTEVDRETRRWGFSLSYLLRKGVSIGVTYTHTRNENKLTSAVSRRNILNLNISFRPTRPYVF